MSNKFTPYMTKWIEFNEGPFKEEEKLNKLIRTEVKFNSLEELLLAPWVKLMSESNLFGPSVVSRFSIELSLKYKSEFMDEPPSYIFYRDTESQPDYWLNIETLNASGNYAYLSLGKLGKDIPELPRFNALRDNIMDIPIDDLAEYQFEMIKEYDEYMEKHFNIKKDE